jgi:hypothetical protein
VRNSGIDSGLFQGPGPESLRIILPDQRQFRGPGREGTANCVEIGMPTIYHELIHQYLWRVAKSGTPELCSNYGIYCIINHFF